MPTYNYKELYNRITYEFKQFSQKKRKRNIQYMTPFDD